LNHNGRFVKLGVVHMPLNRLEEEGFVKNLLGDAMKTHGVTQ
jgi:hypothetical protein